MPFNLAAVQVGIVPVRSPAHEVDVVIVASSVLTCAAVSAIGVAGDPVLFPMMELAAKFACLASVIAAAEMVQAGKVVVQSPVMTPALGIAAATKPVMLVMTPLDGVPSAPP